MSHAEAFGHFRSFAVGLEQNARALRKVLEEECDDNVQVVSRKGLIMDNRKRVNGHIVTARSVSGIARCCSQGEPT